MMGRKRDVYMAIMRAADLGLGVHLTPEECGQLSLDDAIATRASNALTAAECELDWRDIDPYAPRRGANLAGYSIDDPERPAD